jgi:hypothetical protein
VVSNGSNICGVSAYDSKTQTIKIDGFYLETDEIGCEIILSIDKQKSRDVIKVTYSIEQVGT